MDRLAALMAEDLAAVDALIHQHMRSPVGVIPNLAAHLIDAGGKRIRPLITLASARLLGGGGDGPRKLAAAVEFINAQLEAGLLDGGIARCKATTRKGKACQRTPLPSRDYCPSHQHLERAALAAKAVAA